MNERHRVRSYFRGVSVVRQHNIAASGLLANQLRNRRKKSFVIVTHIQVTDYIKVIAVD